MMRSVVPLTDLAAWFRERSRESLRTGEACQTKREGAYHRGRAAAFMIAAEHLERSLTDEGDEPTPPPPLRPVDPPRPPFHQPYA